LHFAERNHQVALDVKHNYLLSFSVHDISLSYSSLPYEGVVQITTGGGTKNVCWQSLKNSAKDVFCRQLGYGYLFIPLLNVSAPTDAKSATFSGSIDCNGSEKYLSQCSITSSANKSCSEFSHIHCTGKIKCISRNDLGDDPRKVNEKEKSSYTKK
jgi:hypothetical protein